MNYITMLQNSLNYIEENLKSYITPDELADQSGFSLYHYYRIFQTGVGRSVMEYITRRRLLHAIYEISLGGKMTDIALLYGFDTYAGFYKAFKKEFKTSPKRYIHSHIISKPYKINLLNKEYLMVNHKKLKQILINWNLSDVELKDIYYEANGVIAENAWYVNDEYIIKVSTNLKGVRHHIEISKALAKLGFNAATPILTTDGNEYHMEDELYYYLTKKLDGRPIKSMECYSDDYMERAFKMGEMIGKLHLVLENFNELILYNEPNLYHTVTQWAIPGTKEVIQLPDEFYNQFIKKFEQLYPLLPKQIIHRDPNPSNIIIKNGELSGFIDFDLTEKNIRIFDPCYLSTAILSESFSIDNKEQLGKWSTILKQIIKGYDAIRPLTPAEKEAIPYVIYAIQFVFIAYLKGKEPLVSIYETNQKMLAWLAENKELLQVL